MFGEMEEERLGGDGRWRSRRVFLGEGPAPARVEVEGVALCGTEWSCEAEEGRGAAV